MYRLPPGTKRNPARRWALPDRVFFACGACHILASAFLDRYAIPGGEALWLRPAAGFTGHHIVVATDAWIFDYHGYSARDRFLAHTFAKARRWWPGWTATVVALPSDVLISEAKSRTYDGLRLREPKQFLHDAMPRAHAFLDRLPTPSEGSGRATLAPNRCRDRRTANDRPPKGSHTISE